MLDLLLRAGVVRHQLQPLPLFRSPLVTQATPPFLEI
jgi:hypothetical protein